MTTEPAQSNTNTTAYPPFASKADFMTAFEQSYEILGNQRELHREILWRLSNTDTSGWADPTARHDA